MTSSRHRTDSEAAIIRWLYAIGEDDQNCIDEVMDQCRNDAEAMAYYVN